MTWAEAIAEAVKQLSVNGTKLTWSIVKAAAKAIMAASNKK